MNLINIIGKNRNERKLRSENAQKYERESVLSVFSSSRRVQKNYVGGLDLLDDELGDPVSLLNVERVIVVVEKDNANEPAVILVDDTGSDINPVLHAQARPRCNL
jgi:hypothetical protein